MKKSISLVLWMMIGFFMLPWLSQQTVSAATLDSFEYRLINDGAAVEITGTVTEEETLTIPAEIEGKPVTAIGDWAFWNNRYRSISIPDSVQTIGMGAFSESHQLEKLILPDSVTKMGSGAFKTSSMTSIKLSKNLKTIEDGTFFDCPNLKSIDIPEGITSLGEEAFGACSVLEQVTFSKTVSRIGRAAFYGCSKLARVTLPPNLTKIEEELFSQCTKLTALTIPSRIKTVGGWAFRGTSITSIAIPSGVSSIAREAFVGAKRLTKIQVSSSNARYVSIDGVLFSKSKKTILCYPIGRTASSYAIPSSVKVIGRGAFAEVNSGLAKLTLPSGVTTIEDAAICSNNLTSISIPASVSKIGGNFMLSCPKLTAINVHAENKTYASVSGVLFNKTKTMLLRYPLSKSGSSYTVPKSVVKVGRYALGDPIPANKNKQLTAVSIPSSVKQFNGDILGASSIKNLYYSGTKSQWNRIQGKNDILFSTVKIHYNTAPAPSSVKYSIRFSANGGKGKMSDQSMSYGSTKALCTNRFTRSGYKFAGWATSSKGTVRYKDKQAVKNLTSKNGAVVTLYARWTKK